MSSYLGTLNSLLTSTTSRYNSLRRNITSTSSEDDTNLTDPSNSHITRVLRAYYAERSLPPPHWLGPDPRDTTTPHPPALTSRPTASLRSTPSDNPSATGLSDLWNDSPPPPPHSQKPLRSPPPRAGVVPPRSQQAGERHLLARPLPSQREGSYQSRSQSGYGEGGRASPGGGGTAQERLKARFGGGGGGGGGRTPPPQ